MIQIYCKNCSNVPGGMQLQSFRQLSAEWEGKSARIPFGEDGERIVCRVVGWTDLIFASPCSLHICKARDMQGSEGYLVSGGNSGVRIYPPKKSGYEEWGQAVVWIEDENDLPNSVREVVKTPYRE